MHSLFGTTRGSNPRDLSVAQVGHSNHCSIEKLVTYHRFRKRPFAAYICFLTNFTELYRTNEHTGQLFVEPNALWPIQPEFWPTLQRLHDLYLNWATMLTDRRQLLDADNSTTLSVDLSKCRSSK